MECKGNSHSRWIQGGFHIISYHTDSSSLSADGDFADEFVVSGAVVVMEPQVPILIVFPGLVHPACVVMVMEVVGALSPELLGDLGSVLSSYSTYVLDVLAVSGGAEESKVVPVVLVGTRGNPVHLLVIVRHEDMTVHGVTSLFGSIESSLSAVHVARSSFLPEHSAIRTRAGLGCNFISRLPVADVTTPTVSNKLLFVVPVCVVAVVFTAVGQEVCTDGAGRAARATLLRSREGTRHQHGGEDKKFHPETVFLKLVC